VGNSYVRGAHIQFAKNENAAILKTLEGMAEYWFSAESMDQNSTRKSAGLQLEAMTIS
jgi:hypothetical protein